MLYSCEENTSVPFFYILSRTPTMDKALFESLTAKAKAILPNYDWSIARIDKQGGNCKYPASALSLPRSEDPKLFCFDGNGFCDWASSLKLSSLAVVATLVSTLVF